MSHYDKKNPETFTDFTKQELKQIQTLSAIRLPLDQMCYFFKNSEGEPMSPAQFMEKYRRSTAAQHSANEGRARGSVKPRQTIYEMATGIPETITREDGREVPIPGKWIQPPNMRALEFWLATQEGFRRQDKVELSGTIDANVKSTVVLRLPPKKKPDV